MVTLPRINRRGFLKTSACAGLAMGTGFPALLEDLHAFTDSTNLSRVEARYYKKHPDREIECTLCPRFCKLGDRERGYCGVRNNQNGTYYTLVYGKACAVHVDPIEKKPLFHFLPKTNALSIATAGCNVNCKFCQNWEISQVGPEQVQPVDLPPGSVVRLAEKYGCPTIAYTYTEPVVFFEYMVDTAKAARRKGIRSIVITGGHINLEPLDELIASVEAIKVDLKAFNQEFYSSYVRGELDPVLEAIKKIAQSDIWLEIVYLVIPTLNDSVGEIDRMSRWIMDAAGPDVPLHFSRFYPMYLLKNLPPTPISTLERARETALSRGLHYVYIGNVPGHPAEDTFCPQCKNLIIQRQGYDIQMIKIKNGLCEHCGRAIAGVWS